MSTNLPVWSTIEAAATLYQKDNERFHLLFSEPVLPEWQPEVTITDATNQPTATKALRLLWLELSPYRVVMTMQESGKMSYRHFWEQGVYGISRYWLQRGSVQGHDSLRLRNYTRSLKLEGHPLPQQLQLDYELWSEKVQLGHYVLNLQVHH